MSQKPPRFGGHRETFAPPPGADIATSLAEALGRAPLVFLQAGPVDRLHADLAALDWRPADQAPRRGLWLVADTDHAPFGWVALGLRDAMGTWFNRAGPAIDPAFYAEVPTWLEEANQASQGRRRPAH